MNRCVRMLLLAALAVLLCAAPALASRSVRYDGHAVLRVDADGLNAAQMLALEKLVDANPQWRLSEWSETDVQVPPQSRAALESYLREQRMPFSIMIEDLQKEIEREDWQMVQHRKQFGLNGEKYTSNEDFFTAYHTMEEINAFCAKLVADFPQLVQPVYVGTTYEGRNITAYKVTSQRGPSVKPGIYLEAGIHAREWISQATITYILNHFVTQYASDPHIATLVDELEWYFVPIVNVDGYVYTHVKDRMWRKTTTPNPGSHCLGVDPNRNWGSPMWCAPGIGGSTNPCDETYCGSKPFSDPTSKAVADFVVNRANIQVAVDFHSYSQLWMEPYGYTRDLPENFAQQQAMARRAVKALEEVYGTKYREGPISTTIYPASGSSADYWYSNSSTVFFSFAVELRDTGRYGFLLPPTQIIPSGIETLAAAVAMGDHLLENPIPFGSHNKKPLSPVKEIAAAAPQSEAEPDLDAATEAALRELKDAARELFGDAVEDVRKLVRAVRRNAQH